MKKNEAISILATSLRPREPKDRARYDEAVKMAVDALNKPEPDTTTHDSIPAETGKNNCDRTSGDCVRRQAESNPLEKCYTCKHVYQRVSDADTLYCRCRKGCRYEEFKPKRSNNDSGRHED